MRKVALVCAGGFCGTLARYFLMAPLLGLAGHVLPGGHSGFPYDIFLINLSGAFALGLLYGLVERGAAISPNVRLALGTGFLGAYTTFSTFVFGGDQLLLSGAVLTGILYLGGSVALGVLCAWAGTLAAGAISTRSHLLLHGLVHVRRIQRHIAAPLADSLPSRCAERQAGQWTTDHQDIAWSIDDDTEDTIDPTSHPHQRQHSDRAEEEISR